VALTFGSLFAGIGGIDLGFERAGMTCLWQVEKDPFCASVLARHWPDVHRWQDIHDVDFTAVPRVDVLAGGFPCQPVSIAGRHQGADDERWLWPEMLRAIRDLQPHAVLAENVIGLRKRGLEEVIDGLTDIGYDTEWAPLTACAVGFPHMRRRLFIAAYPHGSVGAKRMGHRQRPAVQAGDENAGSANNLLDRIMASARAAGGDHDGVSGRLDAARVKALGNAVVPACAEVIGRSIAWALDGGNPHTSREAT